MVSLVLSPLLIAWLDWRHSKQIEQERAQREIEKEDTDRRINKKDVDTQAAVQALLRDKIVDKHRTYMFQGYIDLYSRDSVNRMYVEYKNLGGNSLVDKLMGELDELPTINPNELA